MIRMLLFAKNRFIASAFFQNLICGFGDYPLPIHLMSRFDQDAVADPIKTSVFTSIFVQSSAVARVSEAPSEISRGAPHTLLAYYYELQ